MLREIAEDIVILLSLFGIAVGRLPFLRMNRAALAFPGEFRGGERLSPAAVSRNSLDNPVLLRKSAFAVLLMVAALAAGVPTVLSALAAAGFLLVSRSTESERIFAEIDFPLLVFFAGLFMITRAIEGTEVFRRAAQAVIPLAARSNAAFAGASLALSNLVSNVPAVLLLRPMIPSFGDPKGAWFLLALSSTFAGNLTLLGSVANLIVAEGAKRRGIDVSFGKYLRAGLPITLVTTVLGVLWLSWTAQQGVETVFIQSYNTL